MMEHVTDPYVQLAKKEGWRSRAAFKLMEIDDKDKLLRRGRSLSILGRRPAAGRRWRLSGLAMAAWCLRSTLLEMEPIHGVHFIQGDFREDDVLAAVGKICSADRQVGLVMSGHGPNMSGTPWLIRARCIWPSWAWSFQARI